MSTFQSIYTSISKSDMKYKKDQNLQENELRRSKRKQKKVSMPQYQLFDEDEDTEGDRSKFDVSEQLCVSS